MMENTKDILEIKATTTKLIKRIIILRLLVGINTTRQMIIKMIKKILQKLKQKLK